MPNQRLPPTCSIALCSATRPTSASADTLCSLRVRLKRVPLASSGFSFSRSCAPTVRGLSRTGDHPLRNAFNLARMAAGAEDSIMSYSSVAVLMNRPDIRCMMTPTPTPTSKPVAMPAASFIRSLLMCCVAICAMKRPSKPASTIANRRPAVSIKTLRTETTNVILALEALHET